MMTKTPRTAITLRYFDGCPNWEVARDRLAEAIRAADALVDVSFDMVESEDEALESQFAGSPTILVNGRDPFAEATVTYGLFCRLFETEAGREGSPSIEQFAAILQEAQRT